MHIIKFITSHYFSCKVRKKDCNVIFTSLKLLILAWHTNSNSKSSLHFSRFSKALIHFLIWISYWTDWLKQKNIPYFFHESLQIELVHVLLPRLHIASCPHSLFPSVSALFLFIISAFTCKYWLYIKYKIGLTWVAFLFPWGLDGVVLKSYIEQCLYVAK